jgi:hypothetical protein
LTRTFFYRRNGIVIDPTAFAPVLKKNTEPKSESVTGAGCEQFKVSRSPVRKALLALEKEGSVVLLNYRGAIVTPLSAEEADQNREGGETGCSALLFQSFELQNRSKLAGSLITVTGLS